MFFFYLCEKLFLYKFTFTMNISELFEKIQEDILDELRGEIILEGNCIVWSYDIDRDGMPIDEATDEDVDLDDDELEFDFNMGKSSEELLLDAYEEDLFSIESYTDALDDDCWTFSNPEMSETVISFKIF
jgi:hypothetical protein